MKHKDIKKIMIALDYDPSSQKVAKMGLTMAKAMGAKVILLHVKVQLVNYAITYKKMGSLKLENIEDMQLAAQNFIKNSKHRLEENLIHTIVKEGDFAVSVLETAKDMDVDLIVMGSQSNRWVEEIVLGRVTNKILQHSKIPLLIIPTSKRDKTNTFISLDNNLQDHTDRSL